MAAHEVVGGGGEEGGGPRGVSGRGGVRGVRGGEGAGRVGRGGTEDGRRAAAAEGQEGRVVGVERRRALRGGRPVLLPPHVPPHLPLRRHPGRLARRSVAPWSVAGGCSRRVASR